jgi:hypothetical protein
LLGGIFNWKWTWDPDGHGGKNHGNEGKPCGPC